MSKPTFLHTVPAFACAVALVCALAPESAFAASPIPAASQAPAPDEFRPRQMKVAGDALAMPVAHPAAAGTATAAPAVIARAAAMARPNREVFGFAQWPGLKAGTGAGWDNWNFGLLGTVAYFGVHVNSGDGHLVQSDNGWAGWQSADVTNMINAAHSQGARVVLTIVSQEATGNECNALTHGATTISETVAQVNARGVDGVNIDYESSNQLPPDTCANGQDNRALLRSFTANMRAALGAGRYLTIDTYAAAATDTRGFFDVPGTAPSVDGFFVMAYDLDGTLGGGNWQHAPLNCTTYCFSPNSPNSTYYYNDDRVLNEYIAAAGASKTILGLPYYGYTACVTSVSHNDYPAPTPHWTTPTYLGSVSAQGDPTYAPYTQHRDAYDGADRWDDFNNTQYACHRESYWNDAYAVGTKYDLVNHYGVLGAGIFSLDYGGGSPDLWNQIASHFTLRPTAPTAVTACPSGGAAFLSWRPAATAGGPVTSYTITAAPGGATVTTAGNVTAASIGNLTAGAVYTFTVQAANAQGTGPISTPSNGVAPSTSASTSYFSWYDRASPGVNGDNLHIVNPGATTAYGCAYISGVGLTSFSVGPGAAPYLSFPQGVIGGPVVLSVYSGPAVLAAQRVQYNQSFNEVAARAQGDTALYLPWYDHASTGMWNDNIHVVNPDPGRAAQVTIKGPGAPISLTVPPAGESYGSWPAGTIGGPVAITSDIPVIASQRVQYYNTFNEVAARGLREASTSLLFNWYDRASPGMWNDNIHLVNPNASDANVTVALAGAPARTVTVPANGTTYTGFGPGTIGGPVTLTSTNGVSVLASQRVQYYGSFNEAPAVPAAGLTLQWLPWYDDASPGMVADNVHLVNPGGATVHVWLNSPLGNKELDVQPHAEVYTGWPGRIGGPIQVVANGAGVIASERVQYYQSFNEAIGLS
jgi:spore germination protein YaaH